MKNKDVSLDEVLQECENLEFLNKFSGILRETEYRILLIICGHTKHGKVPMHMVKPILDSYWHIYSYKAHLKNISHVMNIALRKIRTASLYQSFNTFS